MKFWLLIVLIPIALVPFALKAALTKKLLFSNKNYAKQIEVKTYILTQEQVAQLFREPNKEPHFFTSKELNNLARRKRYCVIRVKNLGELHAWGILSCRVRCIHEPFKIPIFTNRNQFCDSVIDISGTVIAEAKNSPYPDMSYEWSELYTK